jgi:hypothetical protein
MIGYLISNDESILKIEDAISYDAYPVWDYTGNCERWVGEYVLDCGTESGVSLYFEEYADPDFIFDMIVYFKMKDSEEINYG